MICGEVNIIVEGVNRLPTATQPYSRQCIICDKLEYDDAEIVTLIPWICPKCKEKLKALLYEEATE